MDPLMSLLKHQDRYWQQRRQNQLQGRLQQQVLLLLVASIRIGAPPQPRDQVRPSYRVS
jgi:hypothetical protein